MKKLIYVVPMKFTALKSGSHVKKGMTVNTILGAYDLEYDAMMAIIDRKGHSSKLDFDGWTYTWTDTFDGIEYAYEACIETTMLHE